MPICQVKDTGLCPTCSLLGRKTTNEESRTLELKDLCVTCRRGLKSSYVGFVNEPRKHWAETLPEPKQERY